MTARKAKSSIQTTGQDGISVEKGPAFSKTPNATPDTEYLESLEQLNRQTGGNALLRVWQILGDKDKKIPALLPIGRTTFWNRVRSGVYPAPVRLGEKTLAWKYSDIMSIINGHK